MRLRFVLAALFLAAFTLSWQKVGAEDFRPCTPESARHLVQQSWRLVRDNFWDPHMKGVDWNQQLHEALHEAAAVRTEADCHAIINRMLSSLHQSHTGLYDAADPMFWYLVGTFGNAPQRLLKHGRVVFEDVGVFTQQTSGGTFVSAVLDGSPAQKGGLQVGDQIVSVGHHPYHGILSWSGLSGHAIPVEIRRRRDGPVLRLTLVPASVEPGQALVDATRRSVRIIERAGKRIGYVHAWSFTREDVQSIVYDAIGRKFRGLDGMVLDIRDGLGGAGQDFMLPWLPHLPRLASTGRDGEEMLYPPRPPTTVVLINQGSRSGKEIIAYAFKKEGLATLVGSRTAGAVSAGRVFYLDDDSLLYVAVERIKVDGDELEGRGVDPDVVVSREIPWCAGRDPQLDAALSQAAGVSGVDGPFVEPRP
ncbi:MAG: S41 family peptidase [Candidatus Xenobia bacterium]